LRGYGDTVMELIRVDQNAPMCSADREPENAHAMPPALFTASDGMQYQYGSLAAAE
jgi:hypothetical protein